MNLYTVRWLLYLVLMKNVSAQKEYFRLDKGHRSATEGSCAEIICEVVSPVDTSGAFWFWMKDGEWNNTTSYYDKGFIVYSTDTVSRPVHPEYTKRVKYVGSPDSHWNYYSSANRCNILICDLKKSDTGEYMLRIIGPRNFKWSTRPNIHLTVTENLCPITFEKPSDVKESGQTNLSCSTLNSCPRNLQISKGSTPLTTTLQSQEKNKVKRFSSTFIATWKDDGEEVSCQTENNEDPYLVVRFNLNVTYAPKETVVTINPEKIIEGQDVTLSCSAKGHPQPTFVWFKGTNENIAASGQLWRIESIRESHTGDYICKATNNLGSSNSPPKSLNVTYMPQVEIQRNSHSSEVKEGDTVTLTCSVNRSNPWPHSFSWFKNQNKIAGLQSWSEEYTKRIEPDDSGFYRCEATNTVGTGESKTAQISVLYRPRKTKLLTSIQINSVTVGHPLTFVCNTDAYPAVLTYSWYRDNRDKQTGSTWWRSKTTETNELHLERVQRADEACYQCNATNVIGTGEGSETLCINVLYPPTNLTLDMVAVATEGQFITITCTVESFPRSDLTLTRTSASNPAPWSHSAQQGQPPNRLSYPFKVTSAEAGVYTCSATNSEGSAKSESKNLDVNYAPKDVLVQAKPGFTVIENTTLTLHCNAHSYPRVASFIWKKMTDGKSQVIHNGQTINVDSVSPSDSGRYTCEASNEIGTTCSEQADVKVMYAPKQTKVTSAEEQLLPDGRSFVTVSCIADSYPEVTHYSWYRKTEDNKRAIAVSNQKHHTVYSDKPGIYYCTAKNEINEASSEPIKLFLDKGIMKYLLFGFVVVTLLVILALCFIHRNKRKNSTGTTSNSGGNRARTMMNEPIPAGPSRSSDDLLPDQRCHPRTERRRFLPECTPASSTVQTAKKLVTQQGGSAKDDSLNYASLHFQKGPKYDKPKTEVNTVYAMVVKPKSAKGEFESLAVYENLSAAHAAKNPDPWNEDSSEEELSYTKVNFGAMAGCQKASSDSSSSDEEETRYTEVKL